MSLSNPTSVQKQAWKNRRKQIQKNVLQLYNTVKAEKKNENLLLITLFSVIEDMDDKGELAPFSVGKVRKAYYRARGTDVPKDRASKLKFNLLLIEASKKGLLIFVKGRKTNAVLISPGSPESLPPLVREDPSPYTFVKGLGGLSGQGFGRYTRGNTYSAATTFSSLSKADLDREESQRGGWSFWSTRESEKAAKAYPKVYVDTSFLPSKVRELRVRKYDNLLTDLKKVTTGNSSLDKTSLKVRKGTSFSGFPSLWVKFRYLTTLCKDGQDTRTLRLEFEGLNRTLKKVNLKGILSSDRYPDPVRVIDMKVDLTSEDSKRKNILNVQEHLLDCCRLPSKYRAPLGRLLSSSFDTYYKEATEPRELAARKKEEEANG